MAEQTREEKEETDDINPYQAVPTLGKEAAIFKDDEDTRNIIYTKDESFLTRIGQLRMTFNVNGKNKSFNGTASVFSIDNDKNLVYAVTCAHNLKYYVALANENVEATSVIFERRQTISQGKSKSIKEYKISEKWIHPKYDPSTAVSSHDLAVIAFPDDGYFKFSLCAKPFVCIYCHITHNSITYTHNTQRK